MYPQGGYKTQTIIQLGNLLAVWQTEQITLRGVRVYFAALAAIAAREAAARSRAATRRPARGVCYRPLELVQLTGLAPRIVRRELRSLERSGLLLHSESEIALTRTALAGSEPIAADLAGTRSTRRPVPLPRPVLRYLARCHRAVVIKTMLAYCVRGLSVSRDGEVRGRGTAKAVWIARVWGLSLRAVRTGRCELIAAGFISRDEGSRQWKLNRDGAYFSINLGFGTGAREAAAETPPDQAPIFAPPAPAKRRESAPPRENKKTPYGLKDQKTRRREATGVEGRERRMPDLKNLLPEDLQRLSSLKGIFRLMTAAGWVTHCEADFQNVVAAAVRANRLATDPVRMFVAIIRRKLWHHITIEQEERARAAIVQDRRRLTPAVSTGPDRSSDPGVGLTRLATASLIARLASRPPAALSTPP